MATRIRNLLRLRLPHNEMDHEEGRTEIAPVAEEERDPTSEKPRYMEPYVSYCRMLAMWPRGDYNFLLYYTVFFSILILDSIMVVAMFTEIIFNSSNLDGLAQVVDYATAYTSAFYRYIYAIFKGRKFIEMIDFMHEHFAATSVGPGRKMTADGHVKVARYISYSYIILIQVWLFHGIIAPSIYYVRITSETYENGTLMYPNEKLRLPVEVRLPFDDPDHPNVVLSRFIHIFSFYTIASIYTFTDVFWFAILVITTGQFTLITHSLRSIRVRLEEEEETTKEAEAENELEIEEVVDACINQHQLTREFVHKMESLIHPLVLVDFLHAVISISFILMDVTIALNNVSFHKFFVLGEYLVVSMFHMWVMDYFGNEMTFMEEQISTAIYEIPWYNYPKKLRTKVLLMVALARNPCRITGGKLYTVSLEFFAGTMRTIFSYLMVLLQLRET